MNGSHLSIVVFYGEGSALFEAEKAANKKINLLLCVLLILAKFLPSIMLRISIVVQLESQVLPPRMVE